MTALRRSLSLFPPLLLLGPTSVDPHQHMRSSSTATAYFAPLFAFVCFFAHRISQIVPLPLAVV